MPIIIIGGGGSGGGGGSTAWADITGKPASFPSDWADVSNIPTTFDPEPHDHALADLSDFDIPTPGTEGQLLGWDGAGKIVSVDADLSVFTDVADIVGSDGDYLKKVSGEWTPVANSTLRTDVGVPATTDVKDQAFVYNLVGTVEPGTYNIISPKVPFSMTLNGVDAVCTSGSGTFDIEIDAVNVTGVTNVAVSSTEASYTATAANVAAVDTRITLVVLTATSLEDLSIVLRYTRG